MYNEYEAIYEELCDRVECGELTLEDAELINDAAYDKYVTEFKADIERYYDDRLTKEKLSHNHDPIDRRLIRNKYNRRHILSDFEKFHERKNKNSTSDYIRNSYYHGQGNHSMMYNSNNPYNNKLRKFTMKDYKRNILRNADIIEDNLAHRNLDLINNDLKREKWERKNK